MQPERLPDINLLPKYERQSTSLFYWFIAIIIFILLLFIAIGYFYITGKNDLEAIEAELAQLDETVETLELEIAGLSADDQATLEQAVAFAENYEIPTSVLVAELDYLLPSDSYFTEYQYRNQVAEITTHVETLDQVAAYTSDLKESEYIRDIQVDEIEVFEPDPDVEVNIVDFDWIHRYEAQHTIQIHKQHLKEGAEADE